MSVRRRRLRMRVAARNDIKATLIFTEQRWGAEQRRRYRAQLYEAMESLLDYPERGRARDEQFVGCRSILVAQHVIFYHLTDAEIIIGRVLHTGQDTTGKVMP